PRGPGPAQRPARSQPMSATDTGVRPRRLGELLVERGLVSDKDLARALALQRHTRDPLGGILLALGLVRRYDLYHTLSELWELPFVDLSREPADRVLLQSLPMELMIRERFVPVTKAGADRKSTRLNSSHDQISYAVFCLKKKKKIK